MPLDTSIQSLSFSPVDTIYVLAACDDGYARHLAVTLLSMFEHTKSRIVVFVAIPDNFSKQDNLRDVIEGRQNEMIFLKVPYTRLSHLRTMGHLTVECYLRCLAGDIIPDVIEKVIYIDCDVLFLGDIKAIWDVDLRGKTIGAVGDLEFRDFAKLGISSDRPYFNSGIVIIDLISWRKGFVGEQAIDFVEKNPERLTWGDQCALNVVLQEDWFPIDRKFNMQATDFGLQTKYGFRFFRTWEMQDLKPLVVHFTGVPHPEYAKPWSYMCEHPFKPYYRSLLQKTAWKNVPQSDLSPANVVRKHLRRRVPGAIPFYHRMRAYLKSSAFAARSN